jgi:hypothetical protein
MLLLKRQRSQSLPRGEVDTPVKGECYER